MKILAVDDDPGILDALHRLLEKEGHSVVLCRDGAEAQAALEENGFDVMFCDLMMPVMDGLQTLEVARRLQPDLTVIMISGHADIPAAVQATKLGAYDFMEKPLNPERVLLELEKIAARRRAEAEMASLKSRLDLEEEMVGSSPAMQQLRELIARVAPTDGRVLIYGENGSGKEPAAREIHRLSGRSGRFVQLNCAALPKELIESELFGYEKGAFTGAVRRKSGLIEEAEGGTLLLDEVGDMSPETQAKLLRVLQENEFTPIGSTKPVRFNVRIISATNKRLEEEIECGRFRRDLYYRLNVIPITVPPLRERAGDIPELAEHFFRLYALRNGKRVKRLKPAALQRLMLYSWPGNVRELRNVMERLCILIADDEIDEEHVQLVLGTAAPKARSVVLSDAPLREQVEAYERRLIEEALQRCNGNVSRTAQMLRTDRANLHKKLKQYGLKPSSSNGVRSF